MNGGLRFKGLYPRKIKQAKSKIPIEAIASKNETKNMILFLITQGGKKKQTQRNQLIQSGCNMFVNSTLLFNFVPLTIYQKGQIMYETFNHII